MNIFCLKLVLHDPIYRLSCSWHFVQWNLDFFWHFCVFIWHDWMLCTNVIACIWATSLGGQVSFKLILNDQHMFWSHLLICFPCICNLGFPGIFIEDYCHFQHAKRQISLDLTPVSEIPDCRPLREIQVAKKSSGTDIFHWLLMASLIALHKHLAMNMIPTSRVLDGVTLFGGRIFILRKTEFCGRIESLVQLPILKSSLVANYKSPHIPLLPYSNTRD